MRLLVTLLAAASLLPSVAPAAAPDKGHPDDLSIQALHNFGVCVVDHAPKGAAELLALDYQSSEYRQKMTRLTKGTADSCGSSFQMRSNQMLLAGALAERLLTAHGTADGFAREVAYDAAKPNIVAHGEPEAIGMCVARTAPKESWAVLTSAPTSDAELAAMKALSPTLSGCVEPGKPLRMNRPALRAIVALGAYKLEHPPVAAPAKAG